MALAVARERAGYRRSRCSCLGFLLPNADLLWRELRAEGAWGSL